jgi:hypothetical protein
MARSQYAAIRPGDILRARKSRAPRLVLSGPTSLHGGPRLFGLALFKIGHSWTGLNPVACYDPWAARRLFEVTLRRGCSERLAGDWWTWWQQLHRAACLGETLPPMPKWPHQPTEHEITPQAIEQVVGRWRREYEAHHARYHFVPLAS